jgi:glycosyltransferase involved in cell wall biosynthesis
VDSSNAAVKVSVIIPVYNPGTAIDGCIASLLGQTMPADELEIVFVDDGSTDGTGDRLRALAAEHAQVQVITIPNSGWPGKPRNVGLDAARGQYVMFVDQDDALEPESLARQHAMGAGNGADVVLGKVISDFRGVNHDLYRRDRPVCTVFDAGLMNSLTPHKMLRTEFLRAEGIRYPEGPRRLEDQLFMTKAYFAATSASVVGSYVCYRYQRREDGRNAGSSRIDPTGYFANLREVLDIVDAHTEPGPVRDGFYRRFLRTEMLGRLGGAKLRAPRPEYYEDLRVQIRRLAEERFPTSVDAGLGAALRVRAALMRHAPLAQIEAHARAVDQVRLDGRLVAVRSTAKAALRLDVEVWLVESGAPLQLEPVPEGGWRLPASLGSAGVPDEARVLEPLDRILGDVVVTHRDQHDEWFLAGPLRPEVREVDGHGELVWVGTARLDPRRAAGGRALRPGVHDLTVRVSALGLSRNKRLAEAPSGVPPLLVDARGHVDQPYTTDAGNFSLRAGAPLRALATILAGAAVEMTPDGIRVSADVRWAEPPADVTLTLTPEGGGPAVTWPASARRGRPTAWEARPTLATARLAPGRYRVRLSLEHRVGKRRRTTSVELGAVLPVSAATTRGWRLAALRRGGVAVVRRTRRRLARALHR